MRRVEFIKRLIVISRPVFWPAIVAVYWFGVFESKSHWGWSTFIGLVFVTFPMGVIICALNDLYDQESDAMNQRKGEYEGAVVTSKETVPLIWAVIVNSLLFISIFALSGHYVAALLTLGVAAFAYTYSVKPIRLKTRPVFDSISNGIWMNLVYILGFTINYTGFSLRLPPLHTLGIVLFCASAIHALGAAADYEIDKKIGDKTIAQYIGLKPTIILSAIAYITCFFLVSSTDIPVRVYFALSSLLILFMWLRPRHVVILRLLEVIVVGVPLPALYLLAAKL